MNNTRIINNIKYLFLVNEAHLKNKSLEDNVYFTLRDIITNLSGMDYYMEANGFLYALTNGINYHERIINLTYTNVLNDKIYIYRLNNWLSHIQKCDFEFNEIDDDACEEEKRYYFDTKKLCNFDDWWLQFEEFKNLISQHLISQHLIC